MLDGGCSAMHSQVDAVVDHAFFSQEGATLGQLLNFQSHASEHLRRVSAISRHCRSSRGSSQRRLCRTDSSMSSNRKNPIDTVD